MGTGAGTWRRDKRSCPGAEVQDPGTCANIDAPPIAQCRKAEYMEEQTRPLIVLQTTLGDITLELDRVGAPVTTDNFLVCT